MMKIVKPLILLITVSTAFGLYFSTTMVQFTKGFFLASILQIILYPVYNLIIGFIAEYLKNQRIKEFSKQGLELKCPCYLAKDMFIPIELNADNSFTCGDCQKNISVEIKAKTFLQTEALDLDKAVSRIKQKMESNE